MNKYWIGFLVLERGVLVILVTSGLVVLVAFSLIVLVVRFALTSLAGSLSKMITWIEAAGNPVLPATTAQPAPSERKANLVDIAKLHEAKEKFKKQFPGITVGIAPGKGLVVRLPEQIDGIPIEVSLIGEVTIDLQG